MKITIKQNHTLILALILAVLFYVIQNHVYKNAGQQIESKDFIFSFQFEFWKTELYKKINDITMSQTYQKLNLNDGKKIKLDQHYISTLYEYKNELRGVLITLRSIGILTSKIATNTTPLIPEAFKQFSNEEQIQFTSKYETFLDKTEKFIALEKNFQKLEQKLNNLLLQMNQEKISDEKQVKLQADYLILISEIYSKDSFLLKYNTSSFKVVDDLINTSSEILNSYPSLVNAYNSELSEQKTFKDTILGLIFLFSIFLNFLKESRSKD